MRLERFARPSINGAWATALKPSPTWRHGMGAIGSLEEAARAATWAGPHHAGAWVAIERAFRDGHTEAWWALEGVAGPFGPQRAERAGVVTPDPLTLPELTTWYLITNLPAPGAPRAATSPLAAARLAELVRLYGLRTWVEQSSKQVKHTLGWAQYQVRRETAMQRHWALVCCAFPFGWWQASHDQAVASLLLSDLATQPTAPPQKKRVESKASQLILAARSAPGQGLARTLPHAQTLLARLLAAAPTPPLAAPA